MRRYISDFINTLSNRRAERVSSLLEPTLISKARLGSIASNLSNRQNFGSTSLPKIAKDSFARAEPIRSNINRISGDINEMFSVSNEMSLMLNTTSKILQSEVAALEAEVNMMEKMVDNFAFLLADVEAYDYGFLEPFEDERFREQGSFTLSDRNGKPFDADGQASIAPGEASLVLSDSMDVRYGLRASLINSNATGYSIYQNDIQNSVTSYNPDGWRLTIASAGAIHSSIPGANDVSGAQVELEFRLEQPSACSAIRLKPSSEIESQLVQVVLFSDESNEGRTILSRPKNFNHELTLHFPVQSVLRFRLILNQSTFKFVDQTIDMNEVRYHNLIRDQIQRVKSARTSISGVQRAIQERLSSPRRGVVSASLPSSDSLLSRSGPIRHIEDIVRYEKDGLWRDSGKRERLPIAMAISSSRLRAIDVDRASHVMRRNHYSNDGSLLLEHDFQAASDASSYAHNYHYELGVKNVSIGLESPKYRGIYISKPFDSSGDIGHLRMKVSDTNIESSDGRDARFITSVEYSVSNVASPSREGDWIPVMPVGHSEVVGERLFIKENGLADLRFNAASEGSITVYRNGYALTDGINYVRSVSGWIGKVKIDPSQYNHEDILTCDYVTAKDYSRVSFEELGFKQPSLASIHDATGAGEQFSSTGELSQIRLSRLPFVDPNQVGQMGYSPMVIRLDSGDVAQNLTDYATKRTVAMPEEGLFYVHQGDVVRFNKPVSQPFRVYYQYLENNVRFRIVLRCNDKEFATPKVDYVNVKAKTRYPDMNSGLA